MKRRPNHLTSSSLGPVAYTEDEERLTCDECGREPGPDENAEDEWRTYYSDGLGDGVTVCPECAELLRPPG